MQRKSVLYIMGIDWNWIYQRPQIFAERLARDYRTTVMFPRSILKWSGRRRQNESANQRILWTIPYQEKNRLLAFASKLLNYKKLKDFHDFDYIYVGYPLYGRYIPEDYTGKIIYDCMDNHEALYPDQRRVEKVIQEEEKLILKSSLLIASSRTLEQKANKIAGYPKARVIRNAVKIKDIAKVQRAQRKSQYRICYIGTISEWFDYDVLQHSLERLTGIEYCLIGPAQKKIDNPKIIYEGIVEHERLPDKVKEYDCLIMPFLLNDIVTAVDPVKLYEYVSYGKCIISVYYPEIIQFEDFVYFYSNEQEYYDLLAHLMEAGFPPKYTEQQQREFLYNNSWEERYAMLQTYISTMEEKG